MIIKLSVETQSYRFTNTTTTGRLKYSVCLYYPANTAFSFYKAEKKLVSRHPRRPLKIQNKGKFPKAIFTARAIRINIRITRDK